MGNSNQPTRKLVVENEGDQIRSGAAGEAEAEFKEQTHKELEDKLEKNNKYWERRICALQERHTKINKIMEEEYIKSVDNMNHQLPKLPPENVALPCQEKKMVLLSCYKMYPTRPLLCAQEVEAFNCCMRNERVRVLNQH